MQAAEQVGEPEFGILRLRLELLEAAQRHSNLVQQRGAIDLLLDVVGSRFLERRRDRLQGSEMRRERGGTEPPVTVVVARHTRLRGGHGIHVPVQIEIRLLDIAEAHFFSSRWQSWSESTRSVRFAASNSF